MGLPLAVTSVSPRDCGQGRGITFVRYTDGRTLIQDRRGDEGRDVWGKGNVPIAEGSLPYTIRFAGFKTPTYYTPDGKLLLDYAPTCARP